MTETQTETNAKDGWNAAAAASAEAQKAEDPKTRDYQATLDIPLSDKELIDLQDKIAAGEDELAEIEARWKVAKDIHKSEVSEKKAEVDSMRAMRRSKKRKGLVNSREFTSFATNTRWHVRLDTGVEFKREPLDPDERQQLMFPEDPEDGQLTLDRIAKPTSMTPDDPNEPPPHDGDAPSSTDITDPESLLDEAMGDDDDGEE